MLKEIDNFYSQQPEPVQSCLLALRDIILKQDDEITSTWKYGMPFFCYRGKMFAYLWVHKQLKQPYIGIVEGNRIIHSNLITGKRSRMKIMLLDAGQDLPLDKINDILTQTLHLYRSGLIKVS
ncbi:DUF1801 domain-containing protein [Mucilaginibacter sp.]|uniref:DUF1801 domain-containing protein n=1 Tax=Mucilaginibacter sp. TaxID=1882438 RepID=UPI0035BC0B80